MKLEQGKEDKEINSCRLFENRFGCALTDEVYDKIVISYMEKLQVVLAPQLHI